ncbi:MAG: phosphate ABC transporter ATP-binding protein [Actinomycetota bacterium]|nr:MAG: phosphate ABC transporter ATP-binding protein [Actinomycetota bacterium]
MFEDLDSGAFLTNSKNNGSPDLIISTNNLTLGFGQKTVLSDISLSVPRGTITALIGPSGSGKTTFLRSLNRMNDDVKGYRRTGDVLFNSESIWRPDIDLLALRRKVGMLFQRANPFPMSIEQNVVAGVRAHRIAKKSQLREIARMRLEEVGLWHAVEGRLHDSPFRLSGGQQQLLCLARVLAIGPDVLLLDEPTSALDPVSIEAVENLIVSLSPAITFIVVTHNLAQARRISHNTAFFFEGQLKEYGPTKKLFEDASQPETQQYVSGRMG